ncbi:hypothetical protein [Marmoricola sp. RAF53]|uniref:hypothetical protein n=1 Tax=Marmoricola sp. RAF53 TaxID=3233059 RepID=UPI003F9A96B0
MVALLAVILVLGLVGLIVVWITARSWARTTRRTKDAVRQDQADPRVQTLSYRVPEGQDPAVLLARLVEAGYAAAVEHDAGERLLVVSCPGDGAADRDRVRALLGSAPSAIDDGVPVQHGVLFEDERRSGRLRP